MAFTGTVAGRTCAKCGGWRNAYGPHVCKTPEEVRDVTARKDAETKMLECLSYLEDGVAELNALDEGQWRWERECTRVARERLALQHDREIVALAAKLARAEIEEVRAALDVAQSEEAERDA